MTDDRPGPARRDVDLVLAAAVDPEYLSAGAGQPGGAAFAGRGLSQVEIDWIVVALLVAFGVELTAAHVAASTPESLRDDVLVAVRGRFS